MTSPVRTEFFQKKTGQCLYRIAGASATQPTQFQPVRQPDQASQISSRGTQISVPGRNSEQIGNFFGRFLSINGPGAGFVRTRS